MRKQYPDRARAPRATAEPLEDRRLMAIFTVTITADAGPGSLREAIVSANASAGVPDLIEFAIGAGTQTIRPNSAGAGALPDITDAVVIDGTAPPAFPSQIVELDGSLAPAGANGLELSTGSANSGVRRLAINRFPANGIEIDSGNNVIEGNLIGTDVTGTIDLGNGADGIDINSGGDNRIGGNTAAQRNVISGNNSDGIDLASAVSTTTIAGNFIGTSAAGDAALGNSGYGIRISGAIATEIGSANLGDRNVISANGAGGVRIAGPNGSRTRLRGNYIGTDATGAAALGNAGDGVSISRTATDAPSVTTIGGANANEGNLISGNADNGIATSGAGAIANPGTVTVLGNRIGTDVTGELALPNGTAGAGGGHGIQLSGGGYHAIIGGVGAPARNLISGNLGDGIRIEYAPDGSRADVRGNYIGTDADGAEDLPNGNDGISIRSANNTIGGDNVAAPGQGNLLSGNGDDGLELNGAAATGNQILGNLIGTDATGLAALGNDSDGIEIEGASMNTIGGQSGGTANVISGNDSDGVEILPRVVVGQPPQVATGNVIRNNDVGLGADGTTPLGNGLNGVVVISGDRNTIGAAGAPSLGNRISANGADGVRIEGGTGNAVRANSIFDNTGLGIDLGADGPTPNDAGDADTGANNLQNFPVLAGAFRHADGTVLIRGVLRALASTTYDIELFSSPAADPSDFGEGRTFIATLTVTTNVAGDVTFSHDASGIPLGNVITATAIVNSSSAQTTAGDTSEFSPAVVVVPTAVADRHAFYNNTVLDGNDPGANPADDAAIAAGKEALVSGAPAPANITALAKGITGIMIDVAGLPANAEQTLGAADFTFRTGAGGDPATWAAAPAPDAITIRRGAGVGGADRITLAWSDATAVKDAWLQVTLAPADAGLAAPDVFYFGNLGGDATGDRAVSVGDVGVVATNFGQADRTPDQGDFTGDGVVTVADVGVLATAFGRTLGAPLLPAAHRVAHAARPAGIDAGGTMTTSVEGLPARTRRRRAPASR